MPVPTFKPHVPATHEHPVFARGHAPVQQPQGAPPQRGRPNARRRRRAKKHKAPTQAKPAPRPKAKSKSWTKEQAAALYPEYAIGTRVQLPFEYATAAGPSTWIRAAGEVKHGYRVRGDRQGFKILSLGGVVAVGGGVGVGGCGGVVGTDDGGGPREVLVVLCRGGAWGVGAPVDVDPRVRAHARGLGGVGLRFEV